MCKMHQKMSEKCVNFILWSENMCYNELEVKQNDQIEKKNRYIFNRMEK